MTSGDAGRGFRVGERRHAPAGAAGPTRTRRQGYVDRGLRRLPIVAAVVLATLVVGPGPVDSQSGGSPPVPPSSLPAGHRVLLLYSEPRLTPAVVAVDGAFRSALEASSPVPVTFYTEFLDINLFDDAVVPVPHLSELLRRKYESRPPDLIVAASSRALRVALRNRADVFFNAPVVFVAVDPVAVRDLTLDRDVTGVWLRMGWAETLETARRLQPGTRRAVALGGVSPADRVWLDQAHRQLPAVSGPVEVSYLTGVSLEQARAEVSRLPSDSIVLIGAFVRDATGRDLPSPESFRQIAAAASVPVYSVGGVATVGTGVVGGHIISFEMHGEAAAGLALRVLAGERPPPTEGTMVPTFDARQLRRWLLDRGRLPPGSQVLFQERSLWSRYRWYILGGGGVLLVQSGLIAGLVVQRRKRRRAQERLAKRLRFETLLADLSSRFAASSGATEHVIREGLQLVGEGLRVDFATVRVLDDKGGEARLAEVWTRPGVAPRPAVIREDQTPWIFAQVRQGRSLHLACPGDLPDEAVVDRENLATLGIGSTVVLPLVTKHEVIGFFSAGTVHAGSTWVAELVSRLRLVADDFANALERRRAEVASRENEAQIRDLAGRVITAQEEERRRIARDLHDGVNQELAALSIALADLGERLPPGTPSEIGEELGQLDARAAALSDSIRDLSHELHPGVLQQVGLVAALLGYCRRFKRAHGVPVVFRTAGDLGTIPGDVGLCLYRVAQEGLGNVVKHAGAREVQVTVEGREGDVALVIRDDGRGFDPRKARDRRGLGLLSLDERVRLVGGRLTVEARPLVGTELRVVVPLGRGTDASGDRSAG